MTDVQIGSASNSLYIFFQNTTQMKTFTHAQILALVRAAYEFRVKPVRFIAEGTFNHVWLCTSEDRKHPVVSLRITHAPVRLGPAQRELQLYHLMSREKVGLPLLAGKAWQVGKNRAITAVVYPMAEGSLADYLRKAKIDLPNLAETVIESIRQLSNNGFVCADMKPENILLLNGSAYMSDFDSNFCQRGTWRRRVCMALGLRKCSLSVKSESTVNDLLFRVMVLQLVIYIQVHFRSNRAEELAKKLYELGVLGDMKKRLPVVIDGVVVSPIAIIRHLLSERIRYNRKVLNYYSEVPGTIHRHEYRAAIANFL